MAALVASGSREAPIVLDDEDDDDDIICLAGPLLPHNTSTMQSGHSAEEPIVLSSTPDPDGDDAYRLIVIDEDDQDPPGPLPSQEKPSLPPQPDQHTESPACLSHAEIGPVSSPNRHFTPGVETHKRKRSPEDFANQRSPRPASPSLGSSTSVPPELLKTLNENHITRPGKRLKAEQERKAINLPERVSYKGPVWPTHIAKASPIPEPGLGPLVYGDQSTDREPPVSKLCLLPNTFGPPERIIGKHTSTQSKRSMFPSEPHDPTRTLVLGLLPKRFRSLDFVLQWCRDISQPDDPAPLCALVIRSLDKALVEFVTTEQADRAFNSPRMTNRDGRTQITATWYCTPNGICHSSSKQPKRTTSREQPAFLAPLFPESNWPSNSSTGSLQHFAIGPPFQSNATFPFAPLSQAVSTFPPIHVLPPLRLFPQSPTQPVEQLASSQGFMTSDYLGFSESDLHIEMKNAETGEGEFKETQEPDILGTTEAVPSCSPDVIAEFGVGDQNLPSQNSHDQSDLHINDKETGKATLSGSGRGRSVSSHKPCPGAVPQFAESYEGSSVDQEGSQTLFSQDDDQKTRRDAKGHLGIPSGSEDKSSPSGEAERIHKSVVVKEKLLTKLRKYKASMASLHDLSGSGSRQKERVDSHSPFTKVSQPSALALPPIVSNQDTSVTKEDGELTPSEEEQPNLSTTLPLDRPRTDRGGDGVADAEVASQIQGDPEDKLAELRRRVLASRRRKRLTLAASAPPFTPTSSSSVAICASTVQSDHFTSSSVSSTASASNNSSCGTTDTQVSSMSTPALSSSSSVGNANLKSASYFDRMATSFLEDVLGPRARLILATELEDSPSWSPAHEGQKVILQEKQRRLEEHLARSKSLLTQWEAASGKMEKARIMRLIKEERSNFEARRAAADAELRQPEAEMTRAHSTPKILSKRPPLRRWPQTKLDQSMIIASRIEHSRLLHPSSITDYSLHAIRFAWIFSYIYQFINKANMLRALQRNRLILITSRVTYSRALSLTPRHLKDPWLLPNTPAHELSTRSPPDLPPPEPIPRPNESVEKMRARLVYQSRKRGTLESDLILSTFAAQNLNGMSAEELREYDRLLDEPDWDIYYWATERRPAPERWAQSPLLQKLRKHARNEGKEIRRMPELS
ncbi:EMI5 [Sanghuangporus sanghuang]